MNENIEKRLRIIVENSTRKAAIKEWKKASEKQGLPLYNYRLDHIDGVVALAKEIVIGTAADLDVVILAAWLHDLAKPGVGGISAERHGIASAEMAKEILTSEKVDRTTINRVAEVIEKHVGLTIKEPLKPIEAQILWEADKILKLGMIGFVQHVLNGIRLFPGRSLDEIAKSLRDFIPLASEISQCMVTPRGIDLATKRLNTLRELSNYLDSEMLPSNKDV